MLRTTNVEGVVVGLVSQTRLMEQSPLLETWPTWMEAHTKTAWTGFSFLIRGSTPR